MTSENIRRYRQTRIVATLGPASSSYAIIKELYLQGVDVFRLNFSHGEHETHKQNLEFVRQVEKETGRPIGVFADLQGPKLRLGVFENDFIDINAGDELRLDLDKTAGNNNRVNLPHPEIIEALQIGSEILLDDGKVKLEVINKGQDFVDTKCIAGKKLSNRKGVNLPDVLLTGSILTKKDRIDLEAALDMGVDWIALSFVQRPEDVAEAKKLINGRAKIISKLEKPSAINQHLQELIDMSDAIMLARGDLGVEMPAEQVPGIQKKVIALSREAGKPIIVATQMLESMISSPTPTRAEASDVATAIYDGTDAVMLSAETAAGDYPIPAVSMMRKIAREVEGSTLYKKLMASEHPEQNHTASDAITSSAVNIAQTISASAIVNYTTSGSTALRTARERPPMPIICLTEDINVARRMSLSFGVHAVHTADVDNFADMISKAIKSTVEQGFAKKADKLVITAGVPFGTPGSTNILRIAWVD